MSDRAVLLRYHEVALKGLNRSWFEKRLALNTRKIIERELGPDYVGEKIKTTFRQSRILIETPWSEEIRIALTRVFGLSSYSPIRKVPTDREAIKKAAIEETAAYFQRYGAPKSFRVQTRRSEKVFPEISTKIDRWVGEAIHEKFPDLAVDLENPQYLLGLEIRKDTSYLWSEKIVARGGLPVGSNGKLLTLISGGLDSPIAAIQVLKRGSPTSFVHFYGTPFVGPEVLDKIEDLVRIVNRFQPDPQPLYIVPFGKIQEKIALVTNPKMRTVLYRRMMVRISCALAKKLRAQAIITGESLGQVASQTLENLSTINEVAELPILRPLITYDKEEIILLARSLGTFETSVRPATDCCTLFADRHPSIRTKPGVIAEQEARFSVQDLVEEALAQIEIRHP